MLELGRRERHLTSGLAVQVLVIGLLIFAYTQAIRYLKYERERFFELREQISQAQTKIAAERDVDVEKLKAQIEQMNQTMVSTESLADWADHLKTLASEKWGFRNVKVEIGDTPEKVVTIPMGRRKPYELKLYALKFEALGTTHLVADLLATLQEAHPLWALETVQCEVSALEEPGIMVRLKWLVAVVPSSEPRKFQLEFPSVLKKADSFGLREELFLSPMDYPNSEPSGGGNSNHFQLTSIQWDPRAPVCVINGLSVRPGDSVEGYQLVVLTSNAAVLKRAREEILLRLVI